MLRSIGFLIVFMSGLQVTALAQTSNCASDPYFRCLDLWRGAWTMYDSTGRTIGSAVVEQSLGGCALTERWLAADGSEGQSLLYVDNKSGNWKQVWIGSNASRYSGQRERHLVFNNEKKLIFQGSFYSGELVVYERLTISRPGEQELVQRIDWSFDGGKTWQQVFLGFGKRQL
jgi:hypothetical protein